MELHHILKRLRERSGLTGTQVCSAVGKCQSWASTIESGVFTPKTHELIILAKLLNVPEAEFLSTFSPGCTHRPTSPSIRPRNGASPQSIRSAGGPSMKKP
jgi:transcriptional regulator with XRE-family HTH domain